MEKPYVWPHPSQTPVTVNVEDTSTYLWEPLVHEPEFKFERKNFTPQNSPPNSPRRGTGTQPLDDPAKRQMRDVIQPSPDGSHRPKPAFKSRPRQKPAGGFDRLPRNAKSHPSDSYVAELQQYGSQEEPIPDWEKIYDLPPHSSTITVTDIPTNVNLKKRLALFESRLRPAVSRVRSVDSVSRLLSFVFLLV